MIRAKKSLGQHFLKSERALDSIVAAGEIRKDEIVLEIGPGTGALTEKLLATGARVIAVEKDDGLFEKLKEKFRNRNLELMRGDILDFQTSDLRIYKLIANIPYNITGAILEKFLSAEHQPVLMVLLVQDEVARRIVARDGKESILSISVKAYGTPRYVGKVPAGSFSPVPQVDSAIISINDISREFFRDFTEEEFFKTLKAGFRAKRKKLSSNLASIYGKDKVQKAFARLNLDENVRAEDLPLEHWRKIMNFLPS